MRLDWTLRCGLAASLVMLAGTALPALAQDDPPQPPPETDPELAPGEEPTDPNDPAAIQERIRKAAELREKLRQERINDQRRRVGENPNASNSPLMPSSLPQPGALPDPAQAAAGGLEVQSGEGEISLMFEGPVDLSAFVDFVARNLRLNIIEDQGLSGRTVVFRAPLTIPREELLPLLRTLVEDAGFAMVREDLGFYRIRAESNIRPNFEGDLATTRIIRTPLIRPSVAAQTITQQIGGAGASTGPGGVTAGTNFRMTPVDELGIIIATGPAGTLATIEAFADKLIQQTLGQEFTRIELHNVSASYARSRLIALNAGANVASAVPQQPGQAQIASASGLLGNLESRLYIDQGNALLFRGDPNEAMLLRGMVGVLDKVTPLVVRRYLAGSVAMEAARAGERLGLGAVTVAGESSGARFGGQTTFPATGVRPGQTDTSSEPAASGFTVDTETGSVIYYGTETQHARVQLLVEEFKLTAIGEDIEIKTYKLLYAKAEGDEESSKGVVDILNDLLQDPSQATARSPFLPNSIGRQGAGQNRTLAEDAPDDALLAPPTEGATRLAATQENTIIVADPARNQIVIKAPRKAQAQFAEIIAKLDEKQPQVMIDVQIVSVTTTDDFNWEADVQLNFGQFSWFSGFGASIVEGTGAVTTLDPRTLPATTPGLTTGWIKSDYLPIAIQTLETIGETHVVSRPSILVNDNATANFESVRTEPYSAASQSSSTTIVSQGGTVDAGTTLEVTPRISAGGDISVEFAVELSDFTGAGSDGLQPPKQTESYQSFVTLPSDSTIVVGGFKLKRDATTENRIPILGEIPLIGNLFKNYNKTQRHATIFVFITPRVMRDPLGEDLRLATRGPMADMEIEPDVPTMDAAVIPISRHGTDPDDGLPELSPSPSSASVSRAPR